MRISRSGSNRPTSSTSKVKGGQSTGFSASISSAGSSSASESAQSANGVSSVTGVGAVDAVLALQGVDSVTERRSRALRKGRRLLDALDKLQLSVLDGATTTAHLGVLKRAFSSDRDQTGDDGLDNALGQIEVRTAVEIAKLERAQLEMSKIKRLEP